MSRAVAIGFVLGLAIGIAGTLFAPDLLGPYLPAVFGDRVEIVEGRVSGKLRDGDRVLLTVETDRGSVLATFTQQVEEIDLLVSTGDTLSMSLPDYAPFVDNPTIERVAGSSGPSGGAGPSADGPPASDSPER